MNSNSNKHLLSSKQNFEFLLSQLSHKEIRTQALNLLTTICRANDKANNLISRRQIRSLMKLIAEC